MFPNYYCYYSQLKEKNVKNLKVIEELLPNIACHLNEDNYDDLSQCLNMLITSAENIRKNIKRLQNKE